MHITYLKINKNKTLIPWVKSNRKWTDICHMSSVIKSLGHIETVIDDMMSSLYAPKVVSH